MNNRSDTISEKREFIPIKRMPRHIHYVDEFQNSSQDRDVALQGVNLGYHVTFTSPIRSVIGAGCSVHGLPVGLHQRKDNHWD